MPALPEEKLSTLGSAARSATSIPHIDFFLLLCLFPAWKSRGMLSLISKSGSSSDVISTREGQLTGEVVMH
jgi:hypothetical protein